MPIDVYSPNTRPWRVIAIWRGIVADEGYVNSGCSGRVHNILHIVRIKGLAVGPTGIFVFWLIQDDGASVCNLSLSNLLGHAL